VFFRFENFLRYPALSCAILRYPAPFITLCHDPTIRRIIIIKGGAWLAPATTPAGPAASRCFPEEQPVTNDYTARKRPIA
jgi:hypothetical protein